MGLLDRIKSAEGFRPRVYDDATGRVLKAGDRVLGTPTIGYGTVDITPRDGENLIISRLARLHTYLKPYRWYDVLNKARQEAVLEMAYNLGYSGLLRFKKMIAALKAHDFQEAHNQCLDSDVARELPKRYGRIAKTILTGRMDR